MTKSYEVTIKEMARYLREELQQIEEINQLDFEISIDGRVHDGDLSIKFKLGSSYGTGGMVEGGDLEAVLVEYMRRFGWDKRNKPLELSFSPATTDEEIPF